MLYTLSEIYDILQSGIDYSLPSTIAIAIDKIEKEIANSSIKKMYSTIPPTTPILPHHSYNNYSNPSRLKFKEKEKEKELSWESIRNFKTTKIEKKEGTEKYINDIRICLNKMSNKNYDIQSATILDYIQKISELEDQDQIEKVANAIFDIASTNKFYSEMYAKIYKDLINLYPIFQTIFNDFLLQFSNNILDLKYIDPNIDYDAFCNYNKQNDRKKATVVFIIHMMKQSVISSENVLDILQHLLQKIDEYMELPDHINEIEEMTELVNLFILEGYVFISTNSDSDSNSDRWKLQISKIQAFSQFKVKDKKSLSSRVIFKYMDLCSFINKK